MEEVNVQKQARLDDLDDESKVEEEPIAKGAPMKLDDYITEEPPYPEARAKRIKRFFQKRERYSAQHDYDERGNLQFIGKSGAVEETVHLKTYVTHDMTFLESRDELRKEAIGVAESAYEEGIQRVREAYELYKTTGAMQPYLAAQRDMADIDKVLSRVRYGSRTIQLMPNPELRDVLFDQNKETRRLFSQADLDPYKKKLFRMVTYEYPYMTLFGNYIETPEDEVTAKETVKEPLPDISVRQKLKDGRMARIFFEVGDGPNGFLSPHFPVDFTLDSAQFSSGLQAYEAERAKELGKDTLREAILKTRAIRTVRFISRKMDTQPKDPKGLWLRIFTAIYQQHPELKERLLATGTDALVFADVAKGPSGAGVGERSADILDPSRWLGENAVGLALETLRYQLREGTAREAPRATNVTERVITEEEQEKAKVGAIIQAKKQFQFKSKPKT